MPAALRAFLLLVAAMLFPLSPAQAQEQIWLQIEAQPTRSVAEERAAAYSSVFPETSGFRLRSGWYAIVIGPYGVAEGAARLNALKAENMIPGDSYIAEPSSFIEQFWPPEGLRPEPGVAPLDLPQVEAEPLDPALEAPTDLATAEEPAVIEPTIAPEETQAEARASEAALSVEDRKILQVALKWFGFYDGGIDGAFGRGTRSSMATWQEAMALEPTGILTSRQRATLVANYEAEVEEFGFATVDENEAGIQVTLPLALVEFDHYEPPFVHYRAKNNSGLTLVLISEPGDAAALSGLYDLLQTLEAMPASGARDQTERDFRIKGLSDTISSYAWAQQGNSTVKGFMLVSTPGQEARDARIIEVMEGSFRSTGATALDPGMVPLEESARRGLVAGLEVRRPKSSHSGFYVDASGAVLTTAQAVDSCSRVTIDHDVEASVKASAEGLALLLPNAKLAPPMVAEFQLGPDRPGAEISVAGYSYGERLPAPVLTFGTLEEAQGLNGETDVKRLALTALPGDAGGPVVDVSGAVTGLLLPATESANQQLPAGVAFAASSASLTAFLKGAGLTPTETTASDRLPPVKLTEKATGMTVLVSCWE